VVDLFFLPLACLGKGCVTCFDTKTVSGVSQQWMIYTSKIYPFQAAFKQWCYELQEPLNEKLIGPCGNYFLSF